jgi:hypothetical protein
MIRHWVTHLPASFRSSTVIRNGRRHRIILVALAVFIFVVHISWFMSFVASARERSKKPCKLERCLLNVSPHLFPLCDRFSCARFASLFLESSRFIMSKKYAFSDQLMLNIFDFY